MGACRALRGCWVLLLLGCEPVPEPEPPPDPIIIGPEPLPAEYSCATACENQRHLGCELGEPTAEGSRCEEVCEVSFNAGVEGLEWDVRGLTQVQECQ